MTSFAEKTTVSPVKDTVERPQPDAYNYQDQEKFEFDFNSHIHLVLKALDFEAAQLQAVPNL